MVQLDQKQIRIGALILAVMIVIIGYYFYTTLQNTDGEIIQVSQENVVEEKVQTNDDIENQIIVHIAGEVKNPGIIKTVEGARIADVIRRSRRTNRASRYYRY